MKKYGSEILFKLKTCEKVKRRSSYIRKSNKAKFTKEEDEHLVTLYNCMKNNTFRNIGKVMKKPVIQCHRRYLELTNKVDEDDPLAFVWT